MTRAAALVFWISLFVALLSAGFGYYQQGVSGAAVGAEVSGEAGGADLGDEVEEGEDEELAEEGTVESGAEEVDAVAAGADGADLEIGGLKLDVAQVVVALGLALVGFVAAWHGAKISIVFSPGVTGSFWGLVSALFLWAAVVALVPVGLYIVAQPIPEWLLAWLIPSLGLGLLGWQIGFWLGSLVSGGGKGGVSAEVAA